MIPQRMKNMANVAEHHVTDAKKFVFSMGRRTMSSVSITSASSSKSIDDDNPNNKPSTKAKTTLAQTNRSDSSLMANTLLWAHLIPPMPVIASTMYRHYSKGDYAL